MMIRKTTSAIIGTAIMLTLAFTPAAQAQSDPQGLGNLVGMMCPKLVLQLVSKPGMAEVLSNKPIDVLSVCACTENTFNADLKLKDYLSFVDQETLRTRMKSPHLKSYVEVRILQSVMTCLAPALDASLSTANPGQ